MRLFLIYILLSQLRMSYAQDSLKHFVNVIDDSTVCHTYEIDEFSFHTCINKNDYTPFYQENLILNHTRDNYYYHGPRISFYPNGKPETVSNYIYGCLLGYYCEWYNNGQIKMNGHYWIDIQGNNIKLNYLPNDTIRSKYGMEVISPGCIPVKDGIWEYFDSIGSLIKSEHWEKGVLK